MKYKIIGSIVIVLIIIVVACLKFGGNSNPEDGSYNNDGQTEQQ